MADLSTANSIPNDNWLERSDGNSCSYCRLAGGLRVLNRQTKDGLETGVRSFAEGFSRQLSGSAQITREST